MKKIVSLIICVFATFSLTACVQNQMDTKPRITDPHILVENSDLYDWLKLERVNYFKRKDDLLVVEAKFKNTTSFNKSVAYKIDWIDENGFTEKSILSRWIVTEVEDGRSFVINAISPSTKIKDFEIRLQIPTSDDKNRKDSYHSDYQN
ncbi:DUF1425 domain-containing protein [Aliarcobacter cryaerophilus]|uniref:DUF1425 domain-containing protein n=1 Tax=Aliarcobacter cryaerophilus TaxID=28198 RepID=UPI003DA43F2B